MNEDESIKQIIKNTVNLIFEFNNSVAWDLDWQNDTPEIQMCLECIDHIHDNLSTALEQLES